MQDAVKNIGASFLAVFIAAAVYWFLDGTHWFGEFVSSVVGLREVAWPVVYFSSMGVMSAFVLLGVSKVLASITWVYPFLFGLLGFIWHLSIYNLFHLGLVAGFFGNGLYFIGAIFYWFVLKNITRPSKIVPLRSTGRS